MEVKFDSTGHISVDTFQAYVDFLMKSFSLSWSLLTDLIYGKDPDDKDNYRIYVHSNGAKITFIRKWTKGKIHCSGSIPQYREGHYNVDGKDVGYNISSIGFSESLDINPNVKNINLNLNKLSEFIKRYLEHFDAANYKVQDSIYNYEVRMRLQREFAKFSQNPDRYSERPETINIFPGKVFKTFSFGEIRIDQPESVKITLEGLSPDMAREVLKLLSAGQ